MKKQKRQDKEAPNLAPDIDYERFGRMMVSIVESGYMNRKQMLKMSFLRGIMAGLGGVLAATLLVGLIVWILSLFDTAPLIGPWIESIRETVETRQ
jgi:hypothetical protein